jgi:hypothetical protein
MCGGTEGGDCRLCRHRRLDGAPRNASTNSRAGAAAAERPRPSRALHEADRYAVAERVALIPLVYGRSIALIRPEVEGWWEFGKSSANFADLVVNR